jgi:hypothetical protein
METVLMLATVVYRCCTTHLFAVGCSLTGYQSYRWSLLRARIVRLCRFSAVELEYA